jgi:prepilin-type N-terminal cleavage/methylation domain-containing protein
MVPVVHRRAGMTLVELLVVVSILGLLAVAVIPNIANTTDSRRSREATRIVTSYIARAHSRAIGKTEWAGLCIMPSSGQNLYAIDLFLADVPAVFRGDDLPSSTTGAGYVFTTANSITTTGTLNGIPVTTGSIGGVTVQGQPGDLIRFDGCGPWFTFDTPLTFSVRSVSATDPVVNHNTFTTPWPAPNVPHTYELLRQPIRAGSPLSLADGRCIDLFWSGYGSAASFVADSPSFDGVTNNPSRFANSSSIFILFDGGGRLRQIVRNSVRLQAAGPVFLLIGRVDRAGQKYDFRAPNSADDSLGANWQYPDSYWVAIDPITGIAKAAECTPNTTDVIDSQYFIRQHIAVEGR